MIEIAHVDAIAYESCGHVDAGQMGVRRCVDQRDVDRIQFLVENSIQFFFMQNN